MITTVVLYLLAGATVLASLVFMDLAHKKRLEMLEEVLPYIQWPPPTVLVEKPRDVIAVLVAWPALLPVLLWALYKVRRNG